MGMFVIRRFVGLEDSRAMRRGWGRAGSGKMRDFVLVSFAMVENSTAGYKEQQLI